MSDHATAPPIPALLSVRALEAWYGESHVLHGIDFDVAPGELVCLLGRNGAGKTTTLKALMGIEARRRGTISVDQTEISALPSREIARLGVGYVPEDRGIFSSLSVWENLILPPILKPGGPSPEHLLKMFPNLAERLKSQATLLSGGEQQMLAIARVLRSGARLLLLDEPTEGLAPVIVKQIGSLLKTLKASGYTIVLVEQNLRFAQSVGDRYLIVQEGRVIDQFNSREIHTKADKVRAYLGL